MQHIAGASTRPHAQQRLLAAFRPKSDGSYTWRQAWGGAVFFTAIMWGLLAVAYAIPTPYTVLETPSMPTQLVFAAP